MSYSLIFVFLQMLEFHIFFSFVKADLAFETLPCLFLVVIQLPQGIQICSRLLYRPSKIIAFSVNQEFSDCTKSNFHCARKFSSVTG